MIANALDTVDTFYSIMKNGNFEALPEIIDSKLLNETPAEQLIQIFRQKMHDFGQLMNYGMVKIKNTETTGGLLMSKAKFEVDYWKKGKMFEYFEMVSHDNRVYKIYFFEHNSNPDLVGAEE